MAFLKLYEIKGKLAEAIDEETGELLIPEEEMDKLVEAEENGLNYYIKLYKNAKATADALKAEKKNIDENFTTRINAATNAMNHAQFELERHLNGSKYESEFGKVSYRKSTTTEEVDADAFNTWADRIFYGDVSFVPDKEAIKKAINEGKEIVGWQVVDHINTQIR